MFVKLHTIAQNKISDTVVWIKASIIGSVYEASAHEKGQREEINCLVSTMDGRMLGVSESPQEVIEAVQTVLKEYPDAS